MRFGLKKACATYQKAMTKVLRDMIHKEMEVHMDDMVVRSMTLEEHYKQIFLERLAKYNVRLNPKKCVFIVFFIQVVRLCSQFIGNQD